MGPTIQTCTGALPATSIVFSGGRTPPTCRCRRRPNSSSSSISEPPKLSASTSPRRCSPAPMRSSSERDHVAHWYDSDESIVAKRSLLIEYRGHLLVVSSSDFDPEAHIPPSLHGIMEALLDIVGPVPHIFDTDRVGE